MEQEQELVDNYGLIGKDIGYSFSRGYFKNKFDKLGIQATYVNFDVPDKNALKELFSPAFAKGYNVTIPYKQDVIPLVDNLNADAEAIGAVNTIKVETDGTLTGYNTDFIGFRDTLLEKFGDTLFAGFGTPDYNSRDLKCLILGTGGASKAVHYAMKQLGVQCTFVSRKRTESTITYQELDREFMEKQTFIVNTTPLGTYPDVEESPDIPYSFLNVTHVAFDLIYNPSESSFLRYASKQGATIINGLRMLELQAEASWSIWNS